MNLLRALQRVTRHSIETSYEKSNLNELRETREIKLKRVTKNRIDLTTFFTFGARIRKALRYGAQLNN